MNALSASGSQRKDRIVRMVLRVVGIFIFVEGLFASVLTYWRAEPTDPHGDIIGYVDGMPLEARYSKRYQAASEMIAGKANQFATEIREWFGSLWRGRRLAYTLAVLSLVGGLACFWLANFLTDPPLPDKVEGSPSEARGP